ncbi:MAG: hypothetical protein HN390_05600 [Anaerolineae bacterium]|jgi:hypothetical protein|nr:hypothetical protein [Anaerolineae bacterium]MBT7190177.1 hypothetical protein [Anaerolineae bacterium]MBT7990446.1 hypothetical protein [Anaerolineae bacterium]
MAGFEKIKAVKRKYEKMLLAKPNVVGVGIGYSFQKGWQTDKVAIVVMVSRKLPTNRLKPAELIPAEIEGIPIDVQEKGEIRSQD